MTRADRLLIAAIAAVALLAWPLAAWAAGNGEPSSVVIAGPAGTSIVPLDTDSTVAVEGRLGTVRVRIEDGSARVVDSRCPDHVCVRTGAVSASGSVVACVPNGVTVTVGRGDDAGLDARVR